MRIFIRNDAGTEILVEESTTTFNESEWFHIVWTDEGGTGKLYINGVEDATDFTYTPTGSLTMDHDSPRIQYVSPVYYSILGAERSIPTGR